MRIRRPHPPSSPAALVGLLLLVPPTACSGGASGGGQDDGGERPRGEPLEFVFYRHGGLCPRAPCGLEITVRDDGTWSARGFPDPDPARGTVESGAASRLATVLAVQWDELTGAPFRGTCPTAYDASESVYRVLRAAEGASAGDSVADPGERVIRELRSCTWDLERPAARRALDRLHGLWEEMGLPAVAGWDP